MTAKPNPISEEVKKPETTQPVASNEKKPEVVSSTKSSSPQENKETQETQEQINWRKFREVKEKEESDRKAKEKEAEAEALKKALDAVINRNTPSKEKEEETEEDEIQRRVDDAIGRREAQRDAERKEKETKEAPIKIRQTFPDFDKVCSQENVDYLEYHHPEAFEALKVMPDSLEKWSKVYNAMKRYIPNTNASKDAAKAERNLNKPQSISSGLAQTGDASPIMALSEERKRDNWQRMNRRMKGLE